MEEKTMTNTPHSLDHPHWKQMPFKVPAGYFDSFYQELSPSLSPRIVHKKKVKPYVLCAVAAVFLLVLTIPILHKYYSTNDAAEEYELYIYSQLDQTTYYEL